MLDSILVIAGVLGTAGWCVLHGLGAVSLARAPRVEDLDPPPPDRWPALSVIVPARDEEHTLGPAIESLLAQEYADLEVVIVNDRSTDGTGEVIDRLAGRDSRVETVHVETLPAGWLGKVHALSAGSVKASGEWLLYTDADVHFSPGILARAVAVAIGSNLDHLTLLPRLSSRGWLHGAVMSAYFNGYVRRAAGSPRIETPRGRPFGFGAFNLVRRGALDRTEGFRWLRMEVLDDLALGALIQRSGGRSGFAVAADSLRVTWYESLAEAVLGFDKNMFGGVAGYSYARLIVATLGTLLLAAGPAALVLQQRVPGLAWVAVAGLACLAAEAIVARQRFGLKLSAGFLAPVAHLLAAWSMIRAGWWCWRRGGVLWRGTLYPLAELRAGRRVRLP